MAIKYFCPKCDRKFIEWGATKLGFKCPTCAEETLLKVGFNPDDKVVKKPALKRRAKKVSVPDAEEEVLVPDMDDFGDDFDNASDIYLESATSLRDDTIVVDDDEEEATHDEIDDDSVLTVGLTDDDVDPVAGLGLAVDLEQVDVEDVVSVDFADDVDFVSDQDE